MAEIETRGVGNPSKAYKIMRPRWRRAWALLGGTERMRAVSTFNNQGAKPVEGAFSAFDPLNSSFDDTTVFLPTFPNELQSTFNWRRDQAVLLQIFDEMSIGLAGRLFGEEIVIREKLDKRFYEDVDRQGTSLKTFVRQVGLNLVRYGMQCLIADLPARDESQKARTRADDLAQNFRSYLINPAPFNIIGASYSVENGIERLDHLRIYEPELRLDLEDFSEKLIKRVRLYLRSGDEVFVQMHEYREDAGWAEIGPPVQLLDGNGAPISDIPAVFIYADREDFCISRLPLEGVIWKNIEHFQSSSDQRHILTLCRFPNIKITGLEDELEDDELANYRSPYSVWQFSGEHGDGAWVGAPTDGIEAGERDLDRIVSEAESMGIRMLTKSKQPLTATAEILDDYREVSPLEDMAVALEGGFKTALKWMAIFEGEKDGGEIILDKRYTTITDDDLAVGTLEKLDARRRIPSIILYKSLQDRGILPKQHEPEEIEQMVADEYGDSPSLDDLNDDDLNDDGNDQP